MAASGVLLYQKPCSRRVHFPRKGCGLGPFLPPTQGTPPATSRSYHYLRKCSVLRSGGREGQQGGWREKKVSSRILSALSSPPTSCLGFPVPRPHLPNPALLAQPTFCLPRSFGGGAGGAGTLGRSQGWERTRSPGFSLRWGRCPSFLGRPQLRQALHGLGPSGRPLCS